MYNLPMPLLRAPASKAIKLQLRRDIVRSIKRGHAWVYADALRDRPPAEPGSPVDGGKFMYDSPVADAHIRFFAFVLHRLGRPPDSRALKNAAV